MTTKKPNSQRHHDRAIALAKRLHAQCRILPSEWLPRHLARRPLLIAKVWLTDENPELAGMLADLDRTSKEEDW